MKVPPPHLQKQITVADCHHHRNWLVIAKHPRHRRIATNGATPARSDLRSVRMIAATANPIPIADVIGPVATDNENRITASNSLQSDRWTTTTRSHTTMLSRHTSNPPSGSTHPNSANRRVAHCVATAGDASLVIGAEPVCGRRRNHAPDNASCKRPSRPRLRPVQQAAVRGRAGPPSAWRARAARAVVKTQTAGRLAAQR